MSDIDLHDDGNGALRVTLSRPARRNAVSLAMWRELAALFGRLAGERGVRSVVVTGAGGHFSGGADIGEFRRERGDAASGARYSEAVDACVTALMALPQPTIAAVPGFCLGGGCSIAMACDFRVAARAAVFGIPAARLGIVYSATDTRNLVSLVGASRARRMLYGALRLDAARALEWGLVDELVEDDAPAAAEALAAGLRGSAPMTIAGAKRTIAHVLGGEPSHATLAEFQRAALESDDYREGVAAFLERRKPVFRGA